MFNLINQQNYEFWYEFISYEELYKAYIDCKKRKRTTHNCESFEINETKNLWKLYKELNTFTYKIGRSTVFIFHEPGSNKFREIFAADFIDRIIQHLLVNRINNIFEFLWSSKSFSCRKEKGTSYGVKCLFEDIKEVSNEYSENCFIITFDIYSFFDSLNKDIMFREISKYIKDNFNLLNIYNKENVNKKDLIFTIWLFKLILYNDPRKNCIFKQPKSFWNNIPKHKSAFHAIRNHYLAVGNITSQLFANIYLYILDIKLNILYKEGRYVDDIYVIIKDIKDFIKVKNIIEEELYYRDLKLQNKKTHIQPYQNGIQFIGKIIKKDRIYILNKTKGKFIKRIKFFYDEFYKNKYITIKDLEYIVNCINSYLGMCKHYTTYKLRKSIMNTEYIKCLGKYCYINKNINKLSIYQDYLQIHKRKHKYYNQIN